MPDATYQKGDRVQLSPRGKQANLYPARLRDLVGIVERKRRGDSATVAVLWPGRKTADRLAVAYVEAVDPADVCPFCGALKVDG